MSQPPNPQRQDLPSQTAADPDRPATSAVEARNESDQSQTQPQPQPTAPDPTKLTPSEVNPSKKHVPQSLSLRSRTATTEIKGTAADVIGTLEDYKEYIEIVMANLQTFSDTLDKDIAKWRNALTEASMPSSMYTRPVLEWQEEVHPGTPAAPSPFQPSQGSFPEAPTPRSTEAPKSTTETPKSTEVQVHWPESAELQQMGEQIIDLLCGHTGQSDRSEARKWLMQMWRYVRAERKRHQDEEREMRIRLSNRVGSECYEKLLLLDGHCLKEWTPAGKEAGEGG